MAAKVCVVKMVWSDDSNTWYALSDDIPGLAIGSDTFEVLLERVRLIAPEMLECNLNYTGAIELRFVAERVEYLKAVS